MHIVQSILHKNSFQTETISSKKTGLQEKAQENDLMLLYKKTLNQ